MSKFNLNDYDASFALPGQIRQQKKVHYTTTLIGGSDKIDAYRQKQAEIDRNWQIQKTLAYAERKEAGLNKFLAQDFKIGDLLQILSPSERAELLYSKRIDKDLTKGPLKSLRIYKDTVKIIEAAQPAPMTFKEKVKVGFDLFTKLFK